MGNMDRKVCLDTDVCIAILRKEPRAAGIRHIIDDRDVCISVITMFELLLRKSNINIVEQFLTYMPHIVIDDVIARKTSSLHKELETKGELIDLRDLFIAATCLAKDCELLTFNKKHFERINELQLL